MHATRVEDRLAKLVAHDTRNPGGDERALAEHLATELGALGASHVEVIPAAGGHASTYARFGEQAPAVILNAHLDTVPANAGCTADPRQLVRRGRRLHGLGAADTKGAIAAILQALAEQRAAGHAPDGIAVLFSGDEELTGTCMREFLASPRRLGLARAVVCEPTDCRVGVRHRGVFAARVTATSTGGHSSLAEQVPNPLTALARAAVALDELGRRYRHAGPEGLRGLGMNVAALEGGVAFNVIPALASLTFSLRPPPGFDLEPLLAEARRAIDAATAPLATTLGHVAANPAFATRALDDFRPWFDDCGVLDLPYGTEAGQFVEQGIDAVVFGPGRVEQAHAADEYVDAEMLERAVAVYARILR